MRWTYGVEHEFGDWDRRLPMPKGAIENRKDHTVMNSNGVAADPKAELYCYGGEINTLPSADIGYQVRLLSRLKAYYHLDVNHRNNLHVHVRVPGLRDDLSALKKVATFNYQNLPRILEVIEPIPMPALLAFQGEALEGALRRRKRQLRSHHYLPSWERIGKRQLAARSVLELLDAECPVNAAGNPLRHLAIRSCVNLRQLLETDTVEFRHFPATLGEEELLTAIEWCRDYLSFILNDDGSDIRVLYDKKYSKRRFPKFPEYVHWKDCRFIATERKGGSDLFLIKSNISKILKGEFDEYPSAMSWQQV
jgi:hypothetical protein